MSNPGNLNDREPSQKGGTAGSHEVRAWQQFELDRSLTRKSN